MGLPAQAVADDQDVRQLKSSDTVDPASGKSYLLYETVENKYDLFFLRSMTSEELESYGRARSEALGKTRGKLREKRGGAPGVDDEELLPDAAFPFIDEDIRNLVRLDSGRVYERNGDRRTYVAEVPPGEYTIYAAGIDGFVGGTCMCMGTVRFRTDAGQIVDLGTILVAGDAANTDLVELKPFEEPEYIRRKALPFLMSVRPALQGDPLPSLFDRRDVTVAQYSAAGPIPNFMGMLINRMVPVDGVLAYEGDRIVALDPNKSIP
ncbi:MAG: hypothetical protein WA948_05670 [Pontixanthobacter sp.]